MPGPTLGRFLEFAQIAIGDVPKRMGAGGSTGDYISLKNYDRCALVCIRQAPTTTGDATKITIQQAKDTTGTSVKGLNVKKVWTKTSTAKLRDVAAWTESTGTLGGTGTTGSTYSGSNLKKAQIIVFDVGSDELDVDNGFDFIRFNVADGGASTGAGNAIVTFYIPYNAKAPNKPANISGVIG